MILIRVFTQHTVLVILLVTNSVTPLLASPVEPQRVTKRKQQSTNIFQEIQNTLIEKGLNQDVASHRTMKLLDNKNELFKKLMLLHESSELSISKDTLVKELAKYALYEKTLNLNSYSAYIGFLQASLSRPLNPSELKYIQSIV